MPAPSRSWSTDPDRGRVSTHSPTLCSASPLFIPALLLLEVSIIMDEYGQLTFLQARAYTKLGNRSLSTLVAYISVA